MRIKMRRTQRGSEDGFTVREYVQGKEYELAPTERGEELGRVFIREGWAEEVKPSPPALDPLSPEALARPGTTPERVAALAREDAKPTPAAPAPPTAAPAASKAAPVAAATPPASPTQAPPSRGSRKGQ